MMNLNSIEKYLRQKNVTLDNQYCDEIIRLKDEAIQLADESSANYLWCLEQVFKIQREYTQAISNLKNGKFEDAWNLFDHADIKLGYLEINFDIGQTKDPYHLMFIGKMIKEYQKLFPYRHFFSREAVIKGEKCSICNQKISLRHPCGHKPGYLYMGKLCLREITDYEFKAISIVTDPFDKYAILKLEGQEYDYGMLEALMPEIENPYTDFTIETVMVKKDEFKNVGRNTSCPCGSGKKYKYCHLGTVDELREHKRIYLDKQSLVSKQTYFDNFSTWKK